MLPPGSAVCGLISTQTTTSRGSFGLSRTLSSGLSHQIPCRGPTTCLCGDRCCTWLVTGDSTGDSDTEGQLGAGAGLLLILMPTLSHRLSGGPLQDGHDLGLRGHHLASHPDSQISEGPCPEACVPKAAMVPPNAPQTHTRDHACSSKTTK